MVGDVGLQTDCVTESSLFCPQLIYKTLEKFHMIRNQLKTAYSRQKSYADNRRRELEFEKGDKVYLKVSLIKGRVRFVKKGKLSPLYVGPYEIFQRVGKVAYELRLPNELDRFIRFSMYPCLRSALMTPSPFFRLKV